MTDEHRTIIHDEWLSQIIQRDTYKLIIEDLVDNQLAIKSDSLTKLQTKPVFLYSKVSTTSIKSIKFLEKHAFNIIDTSILFEKTATQQHNYAGNCDLRFAVTDDAEKVAELARKSFVYSRFHLDDKFSHDLANTIKSEWVNNYFIGERGNKMVVALSDDAIAGFLLLLYQDDSLVIDLIATSNDFRRKGIARDMIVYAEAQCHGFDQIRVGTQLANIPSMQFYADAGFKLASAQYIFHYHNR